ncbi:MAG: PLP-dependent aminotransferase family protein [Betaproteobacteria bacterium]
MDALTTHNPDTTVALRPSRRAAAARSSIVREILKVTQRPDIISLAGGLPSPDAFPVEALRACFDHVLTVAGRIVLQYGPTEGDTGLREWIAAQERERGVPTQVDEVLIVAGSQQALDLIGKALVETGAPMLVDSPTYLGALQAFALHEPRLRTLPSDDAGLVPDALDARLAAGSRLAYVMPTFQNPSGRTLDHARRASLAQAARRHDLWLIEDDPYGELWYRTAPPPSLRTYAPERTIRVCSMSKVLAPGLRLGAVIAPRACIDLLVRIKQATDLHTASLTQRAVLHALEQRVLDAHLPRIRTLYAQQCETMLGALAESMPAGVRWTTPAGGMFVWLTLPRGIDALALLPRAIQRGVAFVPGAAFFAADPQTNTLRLSFVTETPQRLRAAVSTLAQLIAEEQR